MSQVKNKFWEKEIVYQIYPKSFCDSNGDGIGDIQGIISKLDYLKDLGIKIIWLSPIYKSPQFDNGYDISDYYDIDPMFGQLSDFKDLVHEANIRGLKIIMDLVINHTSSEALWFKQSKDVSSKYHQYYIYEKGHGKKPPNNWQSNFSGSAWTYVPEIDEWYLHLYAVEQPDLNWKNPMVYEEVKKILIYWLELGVSGFRCDVINQIYKTSLENGKFRVFQQGREHYLNQAGNHEILKRFRKEVFSKYDCMLVGENFGVSYADGEKFLDNELDMFFQFDHMTFDNRFIPIFKKKFNSKKFYSILKGWQLNCQWNALYLENHDQHRSINRFGDINKYYLESGKLLATLLLTLKGTAYIYQGQELGMLDSKFLENEIDDVAARYVNSLMKKIPILNIPKIRLKAVDTINRDHSRTPMQWNSSTYAGFSRVKPWIKVNQNSPFINAFDAENNPNSIYRYYKKLIALRNETACLQTGDITFLPNKGKVFSYLRTLGSTKYLICLNFSNKSHKTNLVFKDVILNNYESITNILQPYQVVISKEN
jgi:oligo-1,6-glucosidase